MPSTNNIAIILSATNQIATVFSPTISHCFSLLLFFQVQLLAEQRAVKVQKKPKEQCKSSQPARPTDRIRFNSRTPINRNLSRRVLL